jgi:hypothetical protein
MAKPKLKPIRSDTELAELKVQAKNLFFAYATNVDIGHELGLTARMVADWRKEGLWDIERDGIERGLIEDSFGARRLSLARITKLSVDELERGLRHISNRVEPATLSELEKLSMIVGNLDKILRLDMGKSTENIAVAAQVHHTVEDIRAKLAADPILGSAIKDARLPKAVVPKTEFTVVEPELPSD